MLTCFVSKEGTIHLQDENGEFLEYRFDLETRTMTIEPWETERSLLCDAVARNYFDTQVGTPERLMNLAQNNGLSKLELAALLVPEKKRVYLDTCAKFKKALTEACTAKNDPCLEEGCALEGETCLNAVLKAGEIYTTAYVSMWLHLFADPENRILNWRS